MRIISLGNNLDAITIGIIGSREQGEEIKKSVLSACSPPDRERITFLVPRDGISPEVMISGAAKAGRTGSMAAAVWLGCAFPETLPDDVSWPGNIIFVTNYISREHPNIGTLGFVPSFASMEELGLLISGTLSRERDAENTSLEIATLRAEKFRLNKRIEAMEKSVRDAEDFMKSINSMWRAKTRVLKILFVLLFAISSAQFAWLVFSAYDPDTAGRLMQTTHERTFGKRQTRDVGTADGTNKEESTFQMKEDSPVPGGPESTTETEEEIPEELGGPLPEAAPEKEEATSRSVPPPPAPIPVERGDSVSGTED